MNRKFKSSSRVRRRGAILIEVLAGLVLLGTILSSALVARGRFLRQWRDAEHKLSAVEVAEQLLTQWLSLPAGTAAVPGEGDVARSEELLWRTSWRLDPAAQRLGARIAVLEMFDRRDTRQPLLRVEFLLRPAPPTTQPAATTETQPATGTAAGRRTP